MKIKAAQRLGITKEYYFSRKLREIEQINQSGRRVINLGIGSPDLPPPQVVIDTLRTSSANPKHHAYQSYRGAAVLRRGFAQWYQNQYQVTLNPDSEILPLIGSKEGIMHLSMALLDKGDEVLVPNPGYPAYRAVTNLAGGLPINYDLEEKRGWLPNLKKLAKRDLSKVKLMWVNYPNMPTGAKAPFSFFEELIAFGKQHRILICHDNPYSFILNDRPTSLLSVAGALETAIELNSLSKSHNMAGWRVGVLAGEADLLKTILRFKSNMDSGMFLPVQEAAAVALGVGKEWYEQQNAIYQKRRVYLWKIMELLGATYEKDTAGLFVWGKVPDTIINVEAFLDHILHQARVFLTPGFIFGTNGSRYIRLSLCKPVAILAEAYERIKMMKQIDLPVAAN